MATSSSPPSSSSTAAAVVPAKPPSLTWRTRVAMAAISAVTDFACRRDGTVNRRLLSFVGSLDSVSASPTASRGVRTVDFTVDSARGLWFRLFVPTAATATAAAAADLPLLVFFHGGGFAFLSPATRVYDSVCRRLARKLPAVVASVSYRLAPEHKFPSAYVDGVDVLRFLDSSSSSDIAAADLSSVFLVGDSAGANIAHNVARRWAGAGAGEEGWGRVRVVGVVAIQAFFGGEERTEAEVALTKAGAPLVSVGRTDWLWRAFLPEGADRDHEGANVFGTTREELEEGFPGAAMVVVGGWDPLKEWQRRYAEGLRRRGREVRLVEYPEAVHAFYLFPELKEGAMLIEEMRSFIDFHRNSKS